MTTFPAIENNRQAVTRPSPRPSQRGRGVIAAALLAAVLLLAPASPLRADTVESLSGAVIEGKVLSRDAKFIVMEVKVGGKPVQRKYGISLIRAVTIDGVREVLKEGGPATPGTGTGAKTPGKVGGPGPGGTRSKAEVEALINAAKVEPDWLADTQLNLPKSLDMAWPEKPPGGWNNQVNIGQYIWDVTNPNEKRWPEGIKLMHHLMDLHKNNAEIKERAMGTLGGMYHHLFQDYARAAYWWRQTQKQEGVYLAECYFKLGSKTMAMEIVNPMMRQARYPVALVKLLADMGEVDLALKLTEATIKAGSNAADEAMMYAGDACRIGGRFKQAQQYYEKIVALPDTNDNKKSKARARASLDAIKYFDTFDLGKIADGTYKDSSLGYEGMVEVTVVIAGGKFESVKVTNHKEKQYYASINDTPAQIVSKQSVKGVDATSRATITSEAIINASAKAMAQGVK